MFNYFPSNIPGGVGPELVLGGYVRIEDVIYAAYQVGYTDYDTWRNYYQTRLVSWNLSGDLLADTVLSTEDYRPNVAGIANVNGVPEIIYGYYDFVGCQTDFTYVIEDGALSIYNGPTLTCPVDITRYTRCSCCVDYHEGKYAVAASESDTMFAKYGEHLLTIGKGAAGTISFILGHGDYIYVGYVLSSDRISYIDKFCISKNLEYISTTSITNLPIGYCRMKKSGGKAVVCGCENSNGYYVFTSGLLDVEANTFKRIASRNSNCLNINAIADCFLTNDSAVCVYASDNMSTIAISVAADLGGPEAPILPDLSGIGVSLTEYVYYSATPTIRAVLDCTLEGYYHIKAEVFAPDGTTLITSADTISQPELFKLNAGSFPSTGVCANDSGKSITCQMYIGPVHSAVVVFSFCMAN